MPTPPRRRAAALPWSFSASLTAETQSACWAMGRGPEAGGRPSAAPEPPRRPMSATSMIVAGAMALLAKAKWLLIALKGLSAGKLLLTFGSMFLMIIAEAARYGWLYGVGFVALIFIHEMGHAVAIKRAGLQAGYPVFIPFVGAFITLKDTRPPPKRGRPTP